MQSDHANSLPLSAQRRPIVELLLLSLPTVAQFASYVVLQFIDTLMLAWVGDIPATAVGNAGGVVWSVMALGFGTILVVNALVSQSFGRNDPVECGRYLWQGVWFSLIYGTLALSSLPVASWLFQSLGHEHALAIAESQYFRITIAFTAVKLVAASLGQFLLAVNRPLVVMSASIAGVMVNIVANYVLIFGKFGFPALGVGGAAWGTNIALLFELAVLVGFIAYDPRIGRRFNARDWRPRRREMGQLLRVGLPSGLSTVAEVSAWSLFSIWVIGFFGTVAMAAHTYAFRFMMISFMPAVGIGSAVTALVGRYIGAGRPDLAAQRAHLGFAVAGTYMVVCGVGLMVFREPLIGIFSADPEIIRIGGLFLVMMAIYQIFDAMYVVYNGALRGAGDTLVPAIVLGVLVWTFCVGGGYIVATRWPQAGIVGPWVTTTLYGALLGIFLMMRFVKGKWRKIDLDPDHIDATEAGAQPASVSPVLVESDRVGRLQGATAES
jgi:multidrug resistance protein, MATE family